MKKIIEIFKKYSNVLKITFISALSIVIFTAMFSTLKTIDWQQVKEGIIDIGPFWIIVLLLAGIISIIPMLFFDYLLNDNLKTGLSKKYITETSWIINTLNNTVGFGGMISVGLRFIFFNRNKNVSNKDFSVEISRMFLYSKSGISFLSLASLIYLLLSNNKTPLQTPFFSPYIWLIGGTLYFFIVWIFTYKNKIFKNKPDLNLKIFIFSLLEWIGTLIVFYLPSLALGLKINFFQVMVFFIVSTIIGLISLIPGEIGSFDLSIYISLSQIGVPDAQIVMWLLLFRISYYLFPLILSALAGIDLITGSLNERLNYLPKKIFKSFNNNLVVIVLYLTGFILSIGVLFPDFFELYFSSKETFLPNIPEKLLFKVINIILGFSFILIARIYLNKVKFASELAMYAFLLLFIIGIFEEFSLLTQTIFFISMIFIYFDKDQLYRKQFIYSKMDIIKDSFIWIIIVILYIISQTKFNKNIDKYNPHDWLTIFLVTISVIIILQVILFIFTKNVSLIGTKNFQNKTEKILKKYGGNVTSNLVFLFDKRVYFYYPKGSDEPTVAIQFKIIDDKAIVMGDPFGKKEDIHDSIYSFDKYADEYSYKPIWYEINEDNVLYSYNYGYNFFKIGEEAYVEIDKFSLAGKKYKTDRKILTRMQRNKFTFEMLYPPYSNNVFKQLRNVSNNWLGGKKEKGFSLGFFDRSYLNRSPIAIVKNSENQIVAFSSIMPTKTNGKILTIDLMRYDSRKAPDGIMDFMFMKLIDFGREKSFKYFYLGMAPLSNVGNYRNSHFIEKIANLIYQYGSKFYSFEGLRKYKDKYATVWIPRYTSYPKKINVVTVVVSLLEAENKKK